MRELRQWTDGLLTHLERCEHCRKALASPKPDDWKSRLCEDGKHAARGLRREIDRELGRRKR